MIDLSDLLNALLDGGRVTITVTITVTQPVAPLHHTARCAACGWTKAYSSRSSAERGLRTHQTRFCKSTDEKHPSWLVEMHGESSDR